jgi:single-strand DNA-binding protein
MVNKAILIGNVGSDIEAKTIGDNKKVCNFSFATSESFKNKEGKYENKATWHKIIVFGPTCDFIEKYVQKGSKLYIDGKIQNRSYDNKDGQKVYVSEIVANGIKLLDKLEANSTPQPKSEQVEEQSFVDNSNGSDDLPF